MPQALKRLIAPLWGTIVGATLLASCSTPTTETGAELAVSEAPQSAELADLSNTASAPADATPPNAKPQLIKRANMTLRVEKVVPALKAVAQIVKTQQGDVVGLQDQVPPDESVRHQASMELRIPQAKLDATLEQLAQLGTVQNRSMEAEDVSTQLVDFQARLKNLRKSEEVVLKIMDRSGSVADVLKVSQELKTIRQQIEQIDAQVKRLQAQVSYSTVNLSLESAIATTPPQSSLSDRVQEAWTQSTHAVVTLTLGLLSILVWFVVFLPYFIGIGIAGWLVKRWIRRQTGSKNQTSLPAVDNQSINE